MKICTDIKNVMTIIYALWGFLSNGEGSEN